MHACTTSTYTRWPRVRVAQLSPSRGTQFHKCCVSQPTLDMLGQAMHRVAMHASITPKQTARHKRPQSHRRTTKNEVRHRTRRGFLSACTVQRSLKAPTARRAGDFQKHAAQSPPKTAGWRARLGGKAKSEFFRKKTKKHEQLATSTVRVHIFSSPLESFLCVT
jgi:hypothetical protein